MATCDYCLRDMTTTDGCDPVEHPLAGGDPKPPIPHDGDAPCHDCRAAPGKLHHPGCDVERCPHCGGQAISCDCHPAAEVD